jgi:hypothetical protein
VTLNREHVTQQGDSQRRAIVHVGTHKTGTTSFQAWARRYRTELAARTAIHYYDGRFSRNHYELALLCLRRGLIPVSGMEAAWCLGEGQADVRAHIRRQVERPVQSLLCSTENLSYVREPDEVDRLVELLRPREVSVVVVLRDPAEFLRSVRAELGRHGLQPSADPDSITYVEPDSWLLRYDDLLGAYRAVLGPERVTAISYEESVQRDGSIIPAILRACGADTAGLPSWEGLWQHRSRGNKTERERTKQWWREQRRTGV